ncbi:MAG TPA: endonuclease V [Nitrososphaeraceae archaeon]|jgi:deoxyribonuclease V|nr:endonuclease V [Nitrososphaeraceae archaeon]
MKEIYTKIIELQNEFSKKVITHDYLNNNNISNVCGIDVSYKDLNAFCSAVIVDKNTLEIIEIVNEKKTSSYPYIPGLFMLREGELLLKIVRLLKNLFDVLLIDGHGILHPRQCGLASYVGIMIDKPTIGVAKNLLCGSILESNYVEYNKTILGYTIKKNNKKNIYVSVGHKISLETSIDIVKKLTKKSEFIPEPLRIADIYSKKH